MFSLLRWGAAEFSSSSVDDSSSSSITFSRGTGKRWLSSSSFSSWSLMDAFKATARLARRFVGITSPMTSSLKGEFNGRKRWHWNKLLIDEYLEASVGNFFSTSLIFCSWMGSTSLSATFLVVSCGAKLTSGSEESWPQYLRQLDKSSHYYSFTSRRKIWRKIKVEFHTRLYLLMSDMLLGKVIRGPSSPNGTYGGMIWLNKLSMALSRSSSKFPVDKSCCSMLWNWAKSARQLSVSPRLTNMQ